MIFTLLWGSGTKPTIPPKYAYIAKFSFHHTSTQILTAFTLPLGSSGTIAFGIVFWTISTMKPERCQNQTDSTYFLAGPAASVTSKERAKSRIWLGRQRGRSGASVSTSHFIPHTPLQFWTPAFSGFLSYNCFQDCVLYLKQSWQFLLWWVLPRRDRPWLIVYLKKKLMLTQGCKWR